MANGGIEHAALMLGGALNHEFFHGGHAFSASPYSPPVVSSPAAISTEDLDILDSSHVLHPLDHDMLLSSFVSSPTAAADDEWILPSDMNFKSELPPSLSSSAQHATLSHHHQMDNLPVVSSGNCQVVIPEAAGGDVSLSWLLEENKSMQPSSTAKVSLTEAPGTFEMHEVKKSSSQSDFRQFDLCDNSDAMEDDESEKAGLDGKPSLSKNLVSERRRRKKLNERLYSLRAIVPRISKMDKASIVGDAITYVQELKQQIEDMQNDILALESNRVALQQGSTDCVLFGTSLSVSHKILHLDVSKMEEHTFHLRIHCKKGPGALVQLTRALEALDLEILNANLTSVGDHILNTIVVKVKMDGVLKPEELKEMIRGITPKYNLQF